MVKGGPFNPCGLRLTIRLKRIWVEPEPEAHATFRSGGERSNPLSYAGVNKIVVKEVPEKCTLFVPLFLPPRQ